MSDLDVSAPLLAAMLAAEDLAASVAFYLGPYGGDRDALAAQLRRFRETVRVQTALVRGGQIHARFEHEPNR